MTLPPSSRPRWHSRPGRIGRPRPHRKRPATPSGGAGRLAGPPPPHAPNAAPGGSGDSRYQLCVAQICRPGSAVEVQAGRAGTVARWVRGNSMLPPHTLQPDSTALGSAGRSPARGGEMGLTGVPVRPAGCRSGRHQRRTDELRPDEPGTELVLLVAESAIPPLPGQPAGPIALRPGGWQCWMCGQMGRADPPGTANLCCDGCDVW